MSIFGNIMSAIFGHSPTAAAATPASAPAAATPASPAAPSVSAPASAAAPATAAAPAAPVDVTGIMDSLAARSSERLDWRKSIVDLMKLINLDSSLAARKELAQELNYSGDMNDSASMNIWLHKQVMTKLAENGGKVPDELRH
jgi:3-oxoacyl-ACP reductase-like protein